MNSYSLKKIVSIGSPYFIIAIISFIFSIYSHWAIWEYDLFYLIRAGEEILQFKSIQTIETWSHTINGEPWYNFQWLSCILFYLIYKLDPQFNALILFRCVSVFLISIITGINLKKVLEQTSEHFHSKSKISEKQNILRKMFSNNRMECKILNYSLICISLLLLYLTSWLRFQLRGDLLSLILFLLLITTILANSNIDEKNKKTDLIRCKLVLWGIIFIWAQFHTGTVVIGMAIISLLTLPEKEKFKHEGLKSLLPPALYFVPLILTPQTYHIFEIIQTNLGITNNPDLQPFQPAFLQPQNGGFIYSIWLSMTLITWYLLYQFKIEIPKAYKSTSRFMFISVILTLFCFYRIRTVPYAIFFILPVFTLAIRHIFISSYTKQGHWLVLALAGIILWGGLFPYQVKVLSEPIGYGVSEKWFPIKGVEFLKKIKPQKQLLNFFNFGAYLVHELRELPVSIDGREIPFLAFEEEMKRAAKFTVEYERFLKKYQINVIMEAFPERDLIQKHQIFYPKKEWALVYADPLCVIYLRRIQAHTQMIEQYERQSLTESIKMHSNNTAGTSRGKIPTQTEINELIKKAKAQLEHTQDDSE
jgi:hypothetical protein